MIGYQSILCAQARVTVPSTQAWGQQAEQTQTILLEIQQTQIILLEMPGSQLWLSSLTSEHFYHSGGF